MSFFKKSIPFLFVFCLFTQVGFSADSSRSLPRESIQVRFNLEHGMSRQDVSLLYSDDGFFLKVGENCLPIQKCFIAECLRNADWDFLSRYIQAGGKIKITRLAERDYELSVGGGLKGGFVLVSFVAFGTVVNIEVGAMAAVAAAGWLIGKVTGTENPTNDIPGPLQDAIRGADADGCFDLDRTSTPSTLATPFQDAAPDQIGTPGVLMVGKPQSDLDATTLERRNKNKKKNPGAPPAGAVAPAESPIWKGLKNEGSGWKNNGLSGKKRRRYKYDHGDRHSGVRGEIEEYDRRGRHLGAIDPVSGDTIKPRDPRKDL